MAIIGKYDAAMDELGQLYQKLLRLQDLLKDPETTRVRLVCTPERMVVEETRRSYMYLNLYRYPVDCVFINRILPEKTGSQSSILIPCRWRSSPTFRYTDGSVLQPMMILSTSIREEHSAILRMISSGESSDLRPIPVKTCSIFFMRSDLENVFAGYTI